MVLCCFKASDDSIDKHGGPPRTSQRQASVSQSALGSNVISSGVTVQKTSLFKTDSRADLGSAAAPPSGQTASGSFVKRAGGDLASSHYHSHNHPRLGSSDDLVRLLHVLTALEGGWWDQLERAVVATAQHLSATHACIFLLASDVSFALPLALAGPPAPPLCIGTPLPMLAPPPTGNVTAAPVINGPSSSAPNAGSAANGTLISGPPAGKGPWGSGSAVAGTGGVSAGASQAALAVGSKVAAAVVSLSESPPSCAAAALIMEQIDREPERLLIFMDAVLTDPRAAGGCLPPSSPPEWRHLSNPASAGVPRAPASGGSGDGSHGPQPGAGEEAARAAPACRHFAAVAIPVGPQPLGVLSLGANGPGRPSSWTPEALHCTAALLSAPLKMPQVDLTCRALSELSSASTIHHLVRIILGAASELVVAVTRIETQARVAFLQPDVEAAAVFQTAATDVLGPAVRRRLSEVLLVDTSAATAAAGGAGGGGQQADGRSSTRGPAVRGSLGGNEMGVASRSPSLAAAAVMLSDINIGAMGGARAANGEEVSVCRGHSLPLKHTLLSEALAQGTGGLCISDCNAYVQDSKVYPRDLAVSRGAAPAQSLALATSCHCGRPLLALYATYHSILPQGLLQAVVQELGQLLRALTATVAAKVEGALAVEWGYLRHQLLESIHNRSLRSLQPGQQSAHRSATTSNQPGDAATAGATACDSPAAAGPGSPGFATPAVAAGVGLGNAGPSSLLSPMVQRSLLEGGMESPGHPQSVAVSTGPCLFELGAASGSAGLGISERSRVGKRNARTSGRASFSLEAASSPRGSCKLAPLIATLHDRLKAVQAEQMANCRAASRMQDLESIRILEQIGRGGYGVVYRGLYHGSEVAIKVIQEAEVAAAGGSGSGGGGGGGGGGGPLKRMNSVALENKHLHDAIELVASVGMGGHPNIVQVLTFFTDVRLMVGDQAFDTLDRRLSGLDGVAELLRLTRMPSALEATPEEGMAALQGADAAAGPPRGPGGGVIVLVQEFCDAGTLKTAINQRAFYRSAGTPDGHASASRGLQLNLRAVYSTLLEVALALRHMHGLHMVHCDLKPQNVLLKCSPRDPRGFTAKLSDFGLAKMMAHDDKGQLVIDEAVGSGTLTHMAPESLAGQKQLTASIDMFSFGILMWQMVCGTRLYQGLNTRQIIRGVVRENLRPVFPAWVPADYRRLAERCWHQSASERPTASAVVAELEAITLGDHHKTAWRAWRQGVAASAIGSGPGGAMNPGGGAGGGGGVPAAGAALPDSLGPRPGSQQPHHHHHHQGTAQTPNHHHTPAQHQQLQQHQHHHHHQQPPQQHQHQHHQHQHPGAVTAAPGAHGVQAPPYAPLTGSAGSLTDAGRAPGNHQNHHNHQQQRLPNRANTPGAPAAGQVRLII